MKPPGKSTLSRMQRTAQAEVDRIEALGQPADYLIRKRDDFAGIVRLVDACLSDQVIIDRLKARMSAQTVLATDVDAEVAGE